MYKSKNESITKTSPFMLCSDVIAVYWEARTKYINRLCRLLSIIVGDTRSDNFTLKGLTNISNQK
jgi:hypothetical protein